MLTQISKLKAGEFVQLISSPVSSICDAASTSSFISQPQRTEYNTGDESSQGDLSGAQEVVGDRENHL